MREQHEVINIVDNRDASRSRHDRRRVGRVGRHKPVRRRLGDADSHRNGGSYTGPEASLPGSDRRVVQALGLTDDAHAGSTVTRSSSTTWMTAATRPDQWQTYIPWCSRTT